MKTTSSPPPTRQPFPLHKKYRHRIHFQANPRSKPKSPAKSSSQDNPLPFPSPSGFTLRALVDNFHQADTTLEVDERSTLSKTSHAKATTRSPPAVPYPLHASPPRLRHIQLGNTRAELLALDGKKQLQFPPLRPLKLKILQLGKNTETRALFRVDSAAPPRPRRP